MPDWDPNEHPRDPLGKFKSIVGGLGGGQSISLSDGVRVRRSTDKKSFRVFRSKRARYGDGAEAGTATEAARMALDTSANNEHPKAYGGETRFRDMKSAQDAFKTGTVKDEHFHPARSEDTAKAQSELDRIRRRNEDRGGESSGTKRSDRPGAKASEVMDELVRRGQTPTAKEVEKAANELGMSGDAVLKTLNNTGRISGKDHRTLSTRLRTRGEFEKTGQDRPLHSIKRTSPGTKAPSPVEKTLGVIDKFKTEAEGWSDRTLSREFDAISSSTDSAKAEVIEAEYRARVKKRGHHLTEAATSD